MARLEEVASFFREVNLGGTAVGTRINASHAYAERAIAELSTISSHELKAASNLLEASWDTGALEILLDPLSMAMPQETQNEEPIDAIRVRASPDARLFDAAPAASCWRRSDAAMPRRRWLPP